MHHDKQRQKIVAASNCASACPNQKCSGGSCTKEEGHGGNHLCSSCGETW